MSPPRERERERARVKTHKVNIQKVFRYCRAAYFKPGDTAGAPPRTVPQKNRFSHYTPACVKRERQRRSLPGPSAADMKTVHQQLATKIEIIRMTPSSLPFRDTSSFNSLSAQRKTNVDRLSVCEETDGSSKRKSRTCLSSQIKPNFKSSHVRRGKKTGILEYEHLPEVK